jgi:hypothetical protein
VRTVLRRIFGLKRNEMTRLEKLHIIRMIKSRRMRWAGHAVRMAS